MPQNVSDALKEFMSQESRLKSAGYDTELLAENALVARPPLLKPSRPNDQKKIDLCFVGLTHGDEVVGLYIINKFIEKILSGAIHPKAKLAFVLGNEPAALKGKRFLERDLNRAFCVPDPVRREEHRARELEMLFSDCRYIFDIHQTIQPSETAFFMFEYQKDTRLDLVASIDPNLPVVLAFENFSTHGLGIEEFAQPFGATTITVELGQKGYQPEQIDLGLNLCQRYLNAVETILSSPQKRLTEDRNPLYTWHYTGRFLDSEARLDSGWVNFAKVEAGQRLGQHGKEILLAPCSGAMLFPKYIEPQNIQIELFRILRPVIESDFAKINVEPT